VGLERARRAARGPRLAAERDAAEQRLRALIGLTPDAPVELVPSFAAPRALADFQLEGDRPPVLRRLREEHEVAENELRAAILGQVPDLAIGPQYETDGGQRRIGLFGWWTVPLWNANRPAIAAARARRDLARAAYETEYERLVGRLEASRARSAGIAAQRRALEDELLPRVAALRADTDRLVELGEASAVALLQVLIEAQLTRLSLVEARAEESRALAELTHLVGPRPHPASTRP
jgi:outer membrane protein TolC